MPPRAATSWLDRTALLLGVGLSAAVVDAEPRPPRRRRGAAAVDVADDGSEAPPPGSHVMCHLPPEMREHLSAWRSAAQTTAVSPPVARLVVCVAAAHQALGAACDRLLERLRAVGSEMAPPTRRSAAAAAWEAEQRALLEAWGARHPNCTAAGSHGRLLLADHFMKSLADQFAGFARDGLTAKDFGEWIMRFQSAWRLAVQFAQFLQAMSLEGFAHTNVLADSLRLGGRGGGGGAAAGRGPGPGQPPLAPFLPPVFRIARHGGGGLSGGGRLLRHDLPAGGAVLAALRGTAGPRAARGDRRLRLVEVGVFRANLSGHVWDRAARGAAALELHLVDHWGDASRPLADVLRPQPLPWRLASAEAEPVPLGTGSDMAGESNASTLRGVWQRFRRRGARCHEVPHRLPGVNPRAFVEANGLSRAEVFFHRTSSVAAAAAFADGSLDLVYIDADHKWWSVVQDLTAWWPKVRPGGALMGHDFHFNSLMEREAGPGGSSNDVPLAVAAFFRAPLEVSLHSGYAWSVVKPMEDPEGAWADPATRRRELCAFLRDRLRPHWEFEICDG